MHYKFSSAFHQSWHKSLLIFTIHSLIRSKHHAEEVFSNRCFYTILTHSVLWNKAEFWGWKFSAINCTTKRSSKVSAWEGNVLCIIEIISCWCCMNFIIIAKKNLNIGHGNFPIFSPLKEFFKKFSFTDSNRMKNKKRFSITIFSTWKVGGLRQEKRKLFESIYVVFMLKLTRFTSIFFSCNKFYELKFCFVGIWHAMR